MVAQLFVFFDISVVMPPVKLSRSQSCVQPQRPQPRLPSDGLQTPKNFRTDARPLVLRKNVQPLDFFGCTYIDATEPDDLSLGFSNEQPTSLHQLIPIVFIAV